MHRTLIACVIFSAITFGGAVPSIAAAATKAGKRTCDPSKIHYGPRGGKYHLTRDCRKVYLPKGR